MYHNLSWLDKGLIVFAAGVALFAIYGVVSLCWKIPALVEAKKEYWEAKTEWLKLLADEKRKAIGDK